MWYIYCDVLREAEFAAMESDVYNQNDASLIVIESF